MTRLKIFVGICAALAFSLCLGVFGTPVAEGSGTAFCCLDDWQGGNVCPPGQVLASYCAEPCSDCGTFFCFTPPSGFWQQCYR
jgi:hypothetical protein